jgi:hypothetical protein
VPRVGDPEDRSPGTTSASWPLPKHAWLPTTASTPANNGVCTARTVTSSAGQTPGWRACSPAAGAAGWRCRHLDPVAALRPLAAPAAHVGEVAVRDRVAVAAEPSRPECRPAGGCPASPRPPGRGLPGRGGAGGPGAGRVQAGRGWADPPATLAASSARQASTTATVGHGASHRTAPRCVVAVDLGGPKAWPGRRPTVGGYVIFGEKASVDRGAPEPAAARARVGVGVGCIPP